ncbi:MAG: 16S rRNA (cytidine(1402)-2'-O)-methyltransferase [Anaerolineales bacterium]|nr:MAG: 16S rRNA (cytidine(1402)-2'-O)-methyltransferase [Anaerolineales bacterium]
MGTLYLVATPIGNLEDFSARAVRILKEVRLIAAEDTRHTAKLLSHFDIHTPSTSYFEHNKQKKLKKVLQALEKGDVALVSDAGTPGLNDPGFLLVRAALDAGHTVSPIPGPTAPIAALVVSGLPTDRFLYLGYLPRKGGERQRAIREVRDLPYTLIFFETPHRMIDALEDLQAILGDRDIAVAGELTKMYEDVFRGTITQARDYFARQPARGEYTLVIAGQTKEGARWEEDKLIDSLKERLTGETPLSEIARKVSELSGWPRRKVYRLLTDLQSEQENN